MNSSEVETSFANLYRPRISSYAVDCLLHDLSFQPRLRSDTLSFPVQVRVHCLG